MTEKECTLKELYDKACNLYIAEFLKKHDLWDEEENAPYPHEWIGEPGGMLYVVDCYIGFNDIRMDIDIDIDKDVFFEYYHYTVDNEKAISYSSYLRGAR